MEKNSDKKINVLEIYTNSNIGGVQQHILNLLKIYDEEIINSLFCCFGTKGEMGEEVEKLGIKCMFLNRFKYKRFSPWIIIDLYKIMKQHRIHVVKSHN